MRKRDWSPNQLWVQVVSGSKRCCRERRCATFPNINLFLPTLLLLGVVACAPTPVKNSQKLMGRVYEDDAYLQGSFSEVDPGGDGDKTQAESFSQTRSAQLWYHIDADRNGLEVATRLISPQYQATRFYLPTHQSLYGHNSAPALAGFQAVDPATQKPLALAKHVGEDRYVSVENGDLHAFDFSYHVGLSASNNQGEHLLLGPSYLAVPSREVLATTTNIPIEIVVPESYSLVTTWKGVKVRQSMRPGYVVYGFVASTPRELRDSFLFFGPDVIVMEGGPNAKLAFSPEFAQDSREAILRRYTALIQHFETTLGPLPSYTGVVRRKTNTYRRHDEPDGMGRLNGFVIQIPDQQPIDTANFGILIAHEVLHMWNGHRLVAASSSAAETMWMIEGVTQYLALKTSLQLGWISQRRFVQEMTMAMEQFLNNPKRMGKGDNVVDSARFPYDHGTLLAYFMDCSLNPMAPKNSLSNRQLEGWLRFFMQQRGDNTYTLSDLLQSLKGYGKVLNLDPNYINSRVDTLQRMVERPSTLNPQQLFTICPLL